MRWSIIYCEDGHGMTGAQVNPDGIVLRWLKQRVELMKEQEKKYQLHLPLSGPNEPTCEKPS
jgi:hypothetical protein